MRGSPDLMSQMKKKSAVSPKLYDGGRSAPKRYRATEPSKNLGTSKTNK